MNALRRAASAVPGDRRPSVIRALAAFSDRISRSGKLFLLGVACLATVSVAAQLIGHYLITAQTGFPLLDGQVMGSPTQQELAQHSSAFTQTARLASWLFYLLDALFSLGLVLVTSSMTAWGLRRLFPRRYGGLMPWLALFYVILPLDWIEILCLFRIIYGGGSVSAVTTYLTLLSSDLKMAASYAALAVAMASAAAALLASAVTFVTGKRIACGS